MSYISVSDITQTTIVAHSIGGKFELEGDSPLGKVALIRDPLGAGFTYIESCLASTQSLHHGHWS